MFAWSLGLLCSIGLSQAVYVRRQAATITWDGRVPENATLGDFDSNSFVFRPDSPKGQNLSLSQLVVFPGGNPSLFDQKVAAKSIEVTISDKSIFAPGGSNPQSAIRRAELQPNVAQTANNITTTGIKTIHFSIKPDPQRALNLSHEYLMTFLERADFTGDQIMLKTGTLIGRNDTSPNDLVLLGNSGNGSTTLFTTPFTADAFTNFAIKMDFTANTVQVFSSTGSEALTQQTEPLPNDLSGNGDLHFGLFKNPTDPGEDSLRSGFQESEINEGVVYAGIFVEDSGDGAISLS
ncbi:glycoside hydrolase family 131 protein [Zopfia rhizophila CBS 207.26]|uniref:Glycoside hydrolase family 131 protein n=1 Tax=Zopfia rhizophila CBS 207.26 TaxID=1314779 RepID=A0A6A6ETM1_9PEZI|nr:glycoside hydrolase family 131 protein [Zopfia rhizophila CBS 207.26]